MATNLSKKGQKIMSTYGPRALSRIINATALVAPRLAARMALTLFRLPLAGRLKPLHRDSLSSADRFALYADRHKIQTYRWPSTGPRILLMHGWQSNSARWRSLVPYLQRAGYDVISMDAPAHGDSGGRLFDAYQYTLTLNVVAKHYQPDIIVGHSVGAFTAFYYCSHYAHRIKGIIALASPNQLTELTEVFVKLLKFSMRTKKAYDREFTRFFEQDQHYYRADRFVEKLDIPGCVIHDRNDSLNKYEDGVAIAKHWKEATLHTTTRLGHALQSEEVYQIILSELGNITASYREVSAYRKPTA